MKLKRLLSLLLAAVMLFSVTACGNTDTKETTVTTEAVTEEKITETENEEYVIVIDKADEGAVSAAERIVWQMKEVFGTDIKVIDQSEGRFVREIVLGKTNRGEKVDTSKLIRDEFEIKTVGTKVFIDGASADGLYGGAVKFLNDCTDENGLKIADNFSYKDTFEYPVKKLTIEGNDISKYTVYYPEGANELVKAAAEDISYYIAEATGVKLPVKTGTPEGLYIAIVTVESDKEFDDSFEVKCENGSVTISGHANLGAVYGAYDFLEEHLGVRYLTEADKAYPHKAFIVPADSIELSNVNYAEAPYFVYRENTDANNNNPVSKLYRDFIWGTHGNCHTFGLLMNDDPINDSYLDSNTPCLTDKATCEKIIKNLRITIEYYTKQRGAVPGIVSLSYTDNARYCQCDNCEAINTKYGSPAATLVLFMNDVCEDLAEDYPDMKVQTLAYNHTLKAPVGLKAHKNVVIQYCTISSCYNHALYYPCPSNESEYTYINGWAEVADELHCWDYGQNWCYYATPYPMLSYENIMDKHQWLYENNVRLMFQCIPASRYGNFQQICTYMHNLAIWDPYMSEDEYYTHMKDACMGFFGKGWESVYNAIMLLEEKWDRCVYAEASPAQLMMHLYMRPYLDDLISYMESAKLLAETKYQWENIDCAMMQFEFVKIDGEFTKLYNSSNEEDNELIQTMCNELYSKYIKYELPIALASNVVPPAPEKFIKSPSSWKEWVLKCLDPNGDNDNSDRTFDEEGNWIGDPFIWPES